MRELKLALRVIAAIIGIVGAIIMLVINLVYSGANHLFDTGAHTHGFWGLLVFLVALVGAILAIGMPRVGALLMAVAAVAFFFIVTWWAIIPAILLVIAAILAYMDRTKAQPATGRG